MSTKTIHQIYVEILDLFKDKSKFTQGYFQRDENGIECEWRRGVCFCALGAINYVADGHGHHAAQCCLQRVSEHLFDGKAIQIVNDSEGGYENVIKALEFARDLWKDKDPTLDELSMSVKNLLYFRDRSGGSHE